MTTTTKTNTTSTDGAVAVQLLAPESLLVDVNVRHQTSADDDLIASVREHGVLQPIVAVRTPEGQIRVRLGHRRTLAAVAANLPTVPVIVAADEASDTAATVERLVTQYAENQHRTGLSTAEQVDVAAQLALLGVSPAQITKRTRMPRQHVDAALTVAASDLAKAAAARCDLLDLTQAAVIAEFDDDPEAVEQLVMAAGSGQFAHIAQRLRDVRAEQIAREAAAQELRDAGVRVLPERPEYNEKPTQLSQLDDAEGKALTIEGHATCPGHAAYLNQRWEWVPIEDEPTSTTDGADQGHTDTDGEPDDDEDLDDEDDVLTGPRATHSVLVWKPVYVCTDPAAHGHVDRWAGRGHDSGTPRRTLDEMSDTEREAARAERRDVIDSNKAWTSAETVRRTWLAEFALRKTAPKGAARFIASALVLDSDLLNSLAANHRAAEMLGAAEHTGYGRNPALAQLTAGAGEARAQVIALVMVLAAYEDNTSRDHWRRHSAATGRYLRFIEAQGYTLSTVERRACGEEPLPDTATLAAPAA